MISLLRKQADAMSALSAAYVYDPDEHDGVAFENLPDDWKCPHCRQPKEKFNRA